MGVQKTPGARLRFLLPAATVLTAAMSVTKTDVVVGALFGRDLREVASRVLEDDTSSVIRRGELDTELPVRGRPHPGRHDDFPTLAAVLPHPIHSFDLPRYQPRLVVHARFDWRGAPEVRLRLRKCTTGDAWELVGSGVTRE